MGRSQSRVLDVVEVETRLGGPATGPTVGAASAAETAPVLGSLERRGS